MLNRVVGGAMTRFTIAIIKRFPLLLPPPSQQRVILEAMDSLIGPLQQAQLRAKQQVHLLSEYRTRLITDVVTGKLDVRGVAVGLPNEVLESASLSDDTLLVDIDQDEESPVQEAALEEVDL
jgi:type I restriction enzyme S subunit